MRKTNSDGRELRAVLYTHRGGLPTSVLERSRSRHDEFRSQFISAQGQRNTRPRRSSSPTACPGRRSLNSSGMGPRCPTLAAPGPQYGGPVAPTCGTPTPTSHNVWRLRASRRRRAACTSSGRGRFRRGRHIPWTAGRRDNRPSTACTWPSSDAPRRAASQKRAGPKEERASREHEGACAKNGL